eukprot:364321-Chlamydomonas_euryale.AAC.12
MHTQRVTAGHSGSQQVTAEDDVFQEAVQGVDGQKLPTAQATNLLTQNTGIGIGRILIEAAPELSFVEKYHGVKGPWGAPNATLSWAIKHRTAWRWSLQQRGSVKEACSNEGV